MSGRRTRPVRISLAWTDPADTKRVATRAVWVDAYPTGVPGLVAHRECWVGTDGRRRAGRRWTLTHEASGWAIRFGLRSLGEARARAQALGRLGLDWTLPEAELRAVWEREPAVLEAVRAILYGEVRLVHRDVREREGGEAEG